MTNHPRKLHDELSRLAQRSDPTASATMNGESGGVHWKLKVRKLESLGCRIDSADFSCQSNSDSTSVARRICERVTYLMEPLEILEMDAEVDQALARSTKLTPTDRGNGYFEVQVTGDSVEFRRYVAQKGHPREESDFCVTHETLDRLLNDVVDSLAPRQPTRQERYRNR